MKQTYEQRVQALAEKMAPQYFNNQNYPHTWDGGTLNDTHKHYWIGKCTPFARIAVAEMAEAYLWACKSTADASVIRAKMIGLGLIPDAQEVDNG